MCKSAKIFSISMAFEIYFLMRLNSKLNNNGSEGKMTII